MTQDLGQLVGSDEVKLLLTIASARSFSGAAAALGISQPAVSQQVKRLETLVGRPLFRRTRTGVEPTSDGDAVIIYGRAMQSLTRELQRYFDNTSGTVRISIGMSEDFVRSALPSILWLFMRDHPHVEVRIMSGSYEMLMGAIDTRSIDLMVMRRYALLPGAQLLWRERATWVGSADLAKPLKDPVPLILPIAPNPVRDTLTEALRAVGRTWRVRFESPSMAGIEAAMQARLGICGGPLSMRLYEVGPLDAELYGLPPLPDVEFVMVQTERELTGPVAAFAEILRQVAASSYRRPDTT